VDHPDDIEIGTHRAAEAPATPRSSDPAGGFARVTGSDGVDEGHALILRLRARDPSALAELYQAYRGKAFGLALRVLGDPEAAEDAVHAAFLALWERADRIEPMRGRIDSLLMTIVHRRAVDLARRRGRVRQFEAPDPTDATGDQRVDQIPDEAAFAIFEQLLDDGALTERLHSALDSLPAEQREVMLMAYFDGLTHSAIAERLGLPPGTVKSRLRLGMERLRSALGADAASRRNGASR
jgi:RNA polymerase sigma-70 factor, ECF subfamily